MTRRPLLLSPLVASLVVAGLAGAACSGGGRSGGAAADAADDVVAPGDVDASGDGAGAADSEDAADDAAGDAAGDAGPVYATEFLAVDLDGGAPTALKVAVRACAGLHNRAVGGSVYVRMEAADDAWLTDLGLTPASVVGAAEFLEACVAEFPACVRYDYAAQKELMPSILTAAAALGAVPLDVGLEVACEDPALDAVVELAERDEPHLATRYVLERYGDQTTGLAMLNPGYDISEGSDLDDPALTRDLQTDPVDLVFARKLFVVFLVNGCSAFTPEGEVLSDVVNAGRWPTPVGVFGYNNSWNVGGYLFEAQTRCLESRNMGAIPTETGNLSFFSTRRAPIASAGELTRVPPEEIVYDPTRTYVAFVIGDGDNVRFIMTSRRDWLQQRLAACEAAPAACAPVSWSIAPHLPWLAPDVLAWYYASAAQTGRDFFVLPPSGHLYAYPTSLNAPDQARFVEATERDARILGVTGTVHWDWNGTWDLAETDFLPRYARVDGAIRGIFPVNVPFMLPTFPWWPAERFYRVLEGADGGRTVLFRPRQWRGINDSGSGYTVPFYLSPQKMADEIAAYPPGTVTAIYMTSDGGLNLDNSFMTLVGLLPPHVQLVSADAAAKLALAAPGE